MDRQRALWGRLFDVVDEYLKEKGQMNTPPIVSPEEWIAAREKLLVKEKEHTRAGDALAAERRRMPWMAVEKEYSVRRPGRPGQPARPVRGPPPAGRLPRLLRAGRDHYPESGGAYPERACVGCSFVADQVAHPAHLNARDTTLAFVSRAPQAEIQGLKERIGWELIPWYTITDDFDADFGVDEWHGHNAFIRDGDKIFRTYFIDARGDEALGTHLELPRHHRARAARRSGRTRPEGYPQTPPYGWWNYHDAYPRAA